MLLCSVAFAVFNEDNSLVLDMHFDNNLSAGDTPGQAGDSSVYGNAGIISGANWSEEGVVKGSMSFDGLKDYVSISPSSSLNIAGTSPYSISLWVKGLGSKNNSNDGNPVVETLLTKQPEGSCSGGYYLIYRNYDPNPNSSKRVTFGFSQGCYTESYVVSNKSDWESDKWYNIVGTWDGTTSAGRLKLYVNGELDAAATAEYPTIMQNTAALWIGAWPTGPNGYFKGLVDEVKIYKRTLSPEEIKAQYDNAIGTTTTTSTSTTTTTTITEKTATTRIESQRTSPDDLPLIIVLVIAVFLLCLFIVKKQSRKIPGKENTKPATSTKFCPNCGASVSPNDKFCRSCGKSL